MYHHVPSCTIMYHHVPSCTIMYHHVPSCTIMYNHTRRIYGHLQSFTYKVYKYQYKLVMIWTFLTVFLHGDSPSPQNGFPFFSRPPDCRRSMDILCEAGGWWTKTIPIPATGGWATYGYGSIPIDTFLGDEHPFTSYFDVNRRYYWFWHTAICWQHTVDGPAKSKPPVDRW